MVFTSSVVLPDPGLDTRFKREHAAVGEHLPIPGGEGVVPGQDVAFDLNDPFLRRARPVHGAECAPGNLGAGARIVTVPCAVGVPVAVAVRVPVRMHRAIRMDVLSQCLVPCPCPDSTLLPPERCRSAFRRGRSRKSCTCPTPLS